MTSSSVQPSLIQTAYEQMESAYNHATLFMEKEVDPIIRACVMSSPRDSAVKTTMVALQLLGTFFILSALCSAAAPLPILGRVISLLPIPLFSTYSGILPKLYTVLAFAIGHDLLKLVQNKKETTIQLGKQTSSNPIFRLDGQFCITLIQKGIAQNPQGDKNLICHTALHSFAHIFSKGTFLPFVWNPILENHCQIWFKQQMVPSTTSRTSSSK